MNPDYWNDSVATKGALRTAWDEDGDGVEECLSIIVDWLWHRLTPHARVLDLGCGAGRLAAPIAERGCEVIGIDFSSAMIDEANRNRHSSRLTYHLNDGYNIPLDLAPFDAAYSVLFFQHLPHEVAYSYFSQVVNMLKPGGAFVFQYAPGDDDELYSRQRHDLALWSAELGLTIDKFKKDNTRGWTWMRGLR